MGESTSPNKRLEISPGRPAGLPRWLRSSARNWRSNCPLAADVVKHGFDVGHVSLHVSVFMRFQVLFGMRISCWVVVLQHVCFVEGTDSWATSSLDDLERQPGIYTKNMMFIHDDAGKTSVHSILQSILRALRKSAPNAW